MPIKGLTDRAMSFPEIGRIRKGAPKEPNKPGVDLNYFRVIFDEEEVDAAQLFNHVYGDEPSELNIRLPFNKADDVWDAWMEAYLAGGQVHRCNGDEVWFHIDPLTGEKKVLEGKAVTSDADVFCQCRDGQPVAQYKNVKGKLTDLFSAPVGRLKVIIPELRRFAFLTLTTTSQHDIANITAQLAGLQGIHGKIAWIPLKLRRRPKSISVPMQGGKRQRMEKWLVSVEADPDWVDAKLIAAEFEATPSIEMLEGNFKELPAPEAENIPTHDEITPFQPEAQDHPDLEDEIAQDKPAPKQEPKPTPKAEKPADKLQEGQRAFSLSLLDDLVEKQYAMDRSHAASILGRSPWADKAVELKSRKPIYQWVQQYTAHEGELGPEAAAAEATKVVEFMTSK
jgi:hypothetical protein